MGTPARPLLPNSHRRDKEKKRRPDGQECPSYNPRISTNRGGDRSRASPRGRQPGTAHPLRAKDPSHPRPHLGRLSVVPLSPLPLVGWALLPVRLSQHASQRRSKETKTGRARVPILQSGKTSPKSDWRSCPRGSAQVVKEPERDSYRNSLWHKWKHRLLVSKQRCAPLDSGSSGAKFLCFHSARGSSVPNAFCDADVTDLTSMTQNAFPVSVESASPNNFRFAYVFESTDVTQVCFEAADDDLQRPERRAGCRRDLRDESSALAGIPVDLADQKLPRANQSDHGFTHFVRLGVPAEVWRAGASRTKQFGDGGVDRV